jgi:hypothetical protein
MCILGKNCKQNPFQFLVSSDWQLQNITVSKSKKSAFTTIDTTQTYRAMKFAVTVMLLATGEEIRHLGSLVANVTDSVAYQL